MRVERSSLTCWLTFNEVCLLYNARLTYRLSGGGVRGAGLAALWHCFAPLFVQMLVAHDVGWLPLVGASRG